MGVAEFTSEQLAESHEVSAFECGVPSLDDWLRRDARRAQSAGAARTYVWTRAPHRRVLAYYSLAPTQVLRSEVPRSLTGGYSVIPGFLLARLALDRSLQGDGLGSELLVDALERVADAAAIGGGRLIVVDAIDDRARAFYVHLGFVSIGGTARLYLKISTARAAIDAADQ